jgi:hypothetical protein
MPTAPPSSSPLTAALVEFHKKVRTIHESSKAQYGSYADLSTVLAEILPKLAEQGIRLSQTFRPWGEDGTGMLLVTSLKHVSGEEERSELPLIAARSSKGNPLHDWGGAVTYMRRYAVLSILGLAAGIADDDGDSFDGAAPASASKPSRPAAKPSSNGISKAPLPAPAGLLSADELQGIKKAIASLDPDTRSGLVAAFKKQFNTPEAHGIADYIKTKEHADFLTLQLSHVAGVN